MTKQFKIGPQYEWESFGEAEGEFLDGVNSYGYLTNGEITLSVGDVLEISYLSLTAEANRYFTDSATGANRGLVYIIEPDVLRFHTANFDITVDDVITDIVPLDSDEHVLKLTDKFNRNVYRFGSRYDGRSGNFPSMVFRYVKLNGTPLDITWVDTVTVGGQSETKAEIEDHFETLTLFDSYVNGLSVAEDYNTQWIARVATDTITSELTFNINMNGNELILDGENKTTIDNQYGNSIADLISGYGRVINMMGIENSPDPLSSNRNVARNRNRRNLAIGVL